MTAPYVHMIRQLNRELNTELVAELRAENTQLRSEIDRLTGILDDHGICPGYDCGLSRGTCELRWERCCPDCTHRDE